MATTAPKHAASSATALERRQSARLVLVLLLISVFFVLELLGAKLARSDVLEADAFHLLMDVFALAISLGAMRLATRTPSARFTFGLRRAESIAALTNGFLVLGVAAELVRDAIEHLGTTSQPRTGWMLIVATAALIVNGVNAWILHGAMGHHGHAHAHDDHDHAHGHGHEDHDHAQRHASVGHGHGHGHEHDHDHGGAHAHAHAHAPAPAHAHAPAHAPAPARPPAHHGHGHGHLNLRGAWLHLLGDALGSVAAFVAGVAIRFGASPKLDPLASFIVVAILVVGALRLVRDAGLVIIEAAPVYLPVDTVKQVLLSVDGVTHVKSLHVWSLGTGHDAITAHVRSSSPDARISQRACEALERRFAVEYVTVQVDPE